MKTTVRRTNPFTLCAITIFHTLSGGHRSAFFFLFLTIYFNLPPFGGIEGGSSGALSTNADDKYQHADQMRQHNEYFTNERITNNESIMNKSNYQIRIMNIFGQVVTGYGRNDQHGRLYVAIDKNTVFIDMSMKPIGVYFVEVKSGEEVVGRNKVIVTK